MKLSFSVISVRITHSPDFILSSFISVDGFPAQLYLYTNCPVAVRLKLKKTDGVVLMILDLVADIDEFFRLS